MIFRRFEELIMKYKNPGKLSFTAEIQGEGHGAWVDFPYKVEEIFGVRSRVPVLATFDGVNYQGSLSKMGSECHMLLIRKHIRQQIGKTVGDHVKVEVELDQEERKVIVPDDFLSALKKQPKEEKFFQELSYTHQKEYVQWITEAKKTETRLRRIEKALQMLKENKKQK